MRKILLITAFLLIHQGITAQLTMSPSKNLTKAIKKNPAILNAINANPSIVNALNLNEKLLDAVCESPGLLNAITTNPNLISTINTNSDFLKTLTKKDDLLLTLSLNPKLVDVLNSNPELVTKVAKKPNYINTILASTPAVNNASNASSRSVPSSSFAVESSKKEEKKKKSTGSKIMSGVLNGATNGILGTNPLGSLNLLSGNDLQKNIDKSKNKNVFLSKRYDEYVAQHKVVAILPFKVDIEGENKKQITSKKERVRNEKEIEEKIQESLYNFLLRNQDKYTIEFQDINNTNIKLKSSGIMSTLYNTPKEEIAKALGVDAIISGDYVQKLNNKDSKSGTIKITLYDGKNGDWVWKLDQDAGSKYSLIDETNKLMDNLMEKVVNFFPYRSSTAK